MKKRLIIAVSIFCMFAISAACVHAEIAYFVLSSLTEKGLKKEIAKITNHQQWPGNCGCMFFKKSEKTGYSALGLIENGGSAFGFIEQKIHKLYNIYDYIELEIELFISNGNKYLPVSFPVKINPEKFGHLILAVLRDFTHKNKLESNSFLSDGHAAQLLKKHLPNIANQLPVPTKGHTIKFFGRKNDSNERSLIFEKHIRFSRPEKTK